MSFDLGLNDVRSFACPACQEMINTSATQCNFCGAAVDPQWAQQAATWQDNLNRAFNDGNFARNVAQVTVIFYLISFIPFVGGFAGWGFLIGMIAVPIMVARWLFKYHFPLPAERRQHPEWKEAWRRALIAFGIWGALLAVWLVVGVIFTLLGLMTL